VAVSAPPATNRSTILSLTVSGLTPVLVLVAVFVTFRGHNAPGGGFAGGLIVGIVLVLRYLTDGTEAVRRLPVDPIVVIGAGLLLAVATGAVPLLFGSSFLESAIWKVNLPLIGEVKIVSSALFDLGVFTLVAGVVAAILVALAEADDEARRGETGDPEDGGPLDADPLDDDDRAEADR